MADIIELFPDHDDREIKRERGAYCRHTRIGYCEETRTLRCRDCDAGLAPFDTFVKVVREWVSWTEWTDARKAESKRAKAELDELKRQIRNAKAALRRASRA